MPFKKFETRAPSTQNAVDIFTGKWASDLSTVLPVVGTGGSDLFKSDPRPRWAAQALGNSRGRLDGMRVLELGPLEGGHTFQLEQLGAAEIIAVEANAEAYLKCLIVKEALGMTRSRFLFGNALDFIQSTTDTFDLVFCSGILYHMSNPVQLIKACCAVADRCFVWTHYYNAESGDGEGPRTHRPVEEAGFATVYHELGYGSREVGTFWGGLEDIRAWMEQDAILDCFRHFGLGKIDVVQDDRAHVHGAAMSFAASRG